jgi:uncharacterized membrane protein (DUF2068 family)
MKIATLRTKLATAVLAVYALYEAHAAYNLSFSQSSRSSWLSACYGLFAVLLLVISAGVWRRAPWARWMGI